MESFTVYKSSACLGDLIAAKVLPWPRIGLISTHLLQQCTSFLHACFVDGCTLLMQRMHRDMSRKERLSRRKSKPFSESRPLSVISPRDCHITLMKRGALDALNEGD